MGGRWVTGPAQGHGSCDDRALTADERDFHCQADYQAPARSMNRCTTPGCRRQARQGETLCKRHRPAE